MRYRAPVVRVDENYHNQTITLRRDQLLEVSLASNPSTGYQWEYASPVDPDVLEQIDYNYYPSFPIMAGSGGREVWIYRAVGYGETTINLHYQRAYDYSQMPVVFILHVKVV